MTEKLEQIYSQIIQQINASGAIQKTLEKLIPEQNEKFKTLYIEAIRAKEISLQKVQNELNKMNEQVIIKNQYLIEESKISKQQYEKTIFEQDVKFKQISNQNQEQLNLNHVLQQQLNKCNQDNKNQIILINQQDGIIKNLKLSNQQLQVDLDKRILQTIDTQKLLQEQQNQNKQLINDKLNLYQKIGEQTIKIQSLEKDLVSLKEQLKKADDLTKQLNEEKQNLEDHAHQFTLKQLEQENTIKILEQQNDEFKINLKQQNEELKKYKYFQSENQKLEQELGSCKQQFEEKTKQFNQINIKITQVTQDNENLKYQKILKERDIKSKDDEIQLLKSKIAK